MRMPDSAEVALVIDATLGQAEQEVAREVALAVAERAGRIALVVFADHPEYQIGSGMPPADCEVRVSGFLQNTAQVNRWLRQELRLVPHEYLDCALECAIAAAADLSWQREAAKLTLFMGGCLPRNHPDSRLPLRTGLDCPRGRCWWTEFERLERLPHMLTRAATPPFGEPAPIDFANLLLLEVWTALNSKRWPEVLEVGLPARWAARMP